MVKLSDLQLDMDRCVKGRVVWFEGLKITIARWLNPNMQKILDEISKPYLEELREAERKKEPKTELKLKLAYEAAAKGCIINIENMQDDDGNPMEYTPEIGIKIMTDDTFAVLADFIATEAQRDSAYLINAQKDAGKNL